MTDMRTSRTRQYLRDALVTLLRSKPYDQITVREVVQKAQVSRNSFYNHYPDLAALVQDCWMHQSVYFGHTHRRLRDYASRREACTETLNEGAQMLVFFKENPNLARVLLDNVCVSPYFAEMRHAEEALLLDHLETEYGPSALPFLSNEECARFLTWGIFGAYRAWFLNGMVEPVESVAKASIYQALHGMAGMAGRPIEPEYLQAIQDWRYQDRGQAGSDRP